VSWQQPIDIVVFNSTGAINFGLDRAVGKRLVVVVIIWLNRADTLAAMLRNYVHPDTRVTAKALATMWAGNLHPNSPFITS